MRIFYAYSYVFFVKYFKSTKNFYYRKDIFLYYLMFFSLFTDFSIIYIKNKAEILYIILCTA